MCRSLNILQVLNFARKGESGWRPVGPAIILTDRDGVRNKRTRYDVQLTRIYERGSGLSWFVAP